MSELKSPLPAVIDELWERRAELSPEDTAARAEVVAAVDQIDAGNARVAFVDAETDEVVVDERAKRAILLAFKVLPMAQSQVGDFRYHDRVPLKTRLDGVRVVPGAIARWGAYIAPGTVLMPSFTNVGAYVDSGHDGGHLGDGRLRAPRSARTCTCPAGWASAACSSRRTPSRSSSRTSA